MNSITQTMRFRQSLIEYSLKYGVTKAAIKYHTNRQYVYRWRRRYDGTLQSLADHSHHPHSHPNQHTPQELKLIADMRKRNMESGLVVFWVKLRQHGYCCSITGLYRILKKLGQMTCPGQQIQIDVKHVLAACIVGDAANQKLYQYTDEFSLFHFLMAFEEANTYSSTQFVAQMLTVFSFPVECVQTDNGFEFPNQFGNRKPTLFESKLTQLGIRHKLIRPFTPRHNRKVERSHRKDNEYFYTTHQFYSFDDF